MKLVLAIISLFVAIAGIIRWYLKRNTPERRLYADALQHSEKVRLCIKEAEKVREKGRIVSQKALNGELSDGDINRVLSGKAPRNG